jgi:hypothetical protein
MGIKLTGLSDAKLLDKYNVQVGKANIEPSKFIFNGVDHKEIMRLEPNGDIYVHEKLVENDKEVVDGLRQFLAGHGVYKRPAVMTDEKYEKHIQRIKEDAKRYGLTDEDMSSAYLDGMFGRGKLTSSSRIIRIAEIAYHRGMMRGVKFVKEAETQISLRW